MDTLASRSKQPSASDDSSSAFGAPDLALSLAQEDESQHAGEGGGGGEQYRSTKQVHRQPELHLKIKNNNGQRVRERADFSRRSQSSPSSLTKHKFGLRPTPSPPRLIIDHQTGDIVESYPEKPVYLRTYQPLDEHHHPSPPTSREIVDPSQVDQNNRIANYRRVLHKQYATQQDRENQIPESCWLGEEVEQEPEDNCSDRISSEMQQRSPRIPPPHTGKVYFAPPVSSASHLFHQPPPPAHWQPTALPHQRRQQQVPATSGMPDPQQTSSTFKQALNKLNDTNYNPSARTDIAIVPSLLQQGLPQTSLENGQRNINRQQQHRLPPAMEVTKFKPSSSYKNLPGSPLITPTIEDFNLHDLCYLLRIILVFLLSSCIIYLLVAPLDAQCAHYRPTYTHISIILASVNLISVLVFTLFWYSNGVTRTLYSNLSSSAFILSIYSILVALNLTLAILFFFVNTCHLQKIISTPHQLAAVAVVSGLEDGAANPSLLLNQVEGLALVASSTYQPTAEVEQQQRRRRRRTKRNPASSDKEPLMDAHIQGSFLSLLKIDHDWPQLTRLTRRSPLYLQSDGGGGRSTQAGELSTQATLDGGRTNLDDYYQQSLSPLASALQSEPPHPAVASSQPLPPAMSPIEAFWDYLKAHASQLKHSFYQFLFQYDLKFIGALHALCAVCLQYMAMKVAVVRSFFCTPIDPYG